MAVGTPTSGTVPASYSPIVNDYLNAVQTIIEQNIEAVKANNYLDEVFPFVEVTDENGTEATEALIAMAEEQAFDGTGTNIWDAHDPDIYTEIFTNGWDIKQFIVTKRFDEIRKALIKGKSAEETASKILESISEGQADYNLRYNLSLFDTSLNFYTDYTDISGEVPANMDGVLYAIRDAYNYLVGTNEGGKAYGTPFRSFTKPKDAFICLPTKLLNLLDVGRLANVLNLEKVDLMGKIVPIDVTADADASRYYTAFIIDRKCIKKWRRINDYAEDRNNTGRFTQHIKTQEVMFGLCGLFKALYIDCSVACGAYLSSITNPVTYNITNTLSHCTTSNPAVLINSGATYNATISASSGYTLTGATVQITKGGVDISATAYNNGVISIPNVNGDLVIKVTAVSA